MSQTSNQRSEDFLKISDQFKLGALVTESSHPVTANLSDTAKADLPAALRLLFEVDTDVVRKYQEFVESGRTSGIKETLLHSLMGGGKIFFTGCGSTGRLSIQLVSIWRDFWQRQRAQGLRSSPPPQEFEQRAFSVMAGGDFALIKAVEGFEDFTAFGKKQIGDLAVCSRDVVFAITEGGETSFVIGTAWKGVEVGAKVYFVYNNPDDVLRAHVQRSREVIEDPRIEKINLTTGPMAITGSTRMQATTIQLAVLLTILEMVLRELLPGLECNARAEDSKASAPAKTGPRFSLALKSRSIGTSEGERAGVRGLSVTPGQTRALPSDSNAVPSAFLNKLSELHATLTSPPLLAQLAKLTALEEAVYRSGHKNNYFADRLGIDMLTDTTERSPTYCTPPFRKHDDATATESWAFLFVPSPSTPVAWEHIIKRPPRCVEWPEAEVRDLVGEEKAPRTIEIVRKISYKELMRFTVGLDGLRYRPLGRGDCAVGIVSETEKSSLLSPGGFHRVQLEAARNAGASTGLIYFGAQESLAEIRTFLDQWDPNCVAVLVPVPATDFLLDATTRIAVKTLLNTLSTCTMVRLGRVMGNYMIWVVPSNLKLIDRSTRYIQKLTGLDYQAANNLLFEVIEYVEPRMKADQAYPPVVGVSVMRARHGLSNEEAEKKLMNEMG